jgi:hypothetical protein
MTPKNLRLSSIKLMLDSLFTLTLRISAKKKALSGAA